MYYNPIKQLSSHCCTNIWKFDTKVLADCSPINCMHDCDACLLLTHTIISTISSNAPLMLFHGFRFSINTEFCRNAADRWQQFPLAAIIQHTAQLATVNYLKAAIMLLWWWYECCKPENNKMGILPNATETLRIARIKFYSYCTVITWDDNS